MLLTLLQRFVYALFIQQHSPRASRCDVVSSNPFSQLKYFISGRNDFAPRRESQTSDLALSVD
jgi:hypothetical protein